eukprot:g12985.t1
MDPETDDTYVSKTLESLRRRLFAQRLRLEEAQEQLTAADGPFPLAEEEVLDLGLPENMGPSHLAFSQGFQQIPRRYLCYQKGPNSLTCHTLPEFFSDSFARHTDKDFLVYEGDRFTYGETLDIAVALSRTLAQTYGVQRGSCVAIAGRNFPEKGVVLTHRGICSATNTLSLWNYGKEVSSQRNVILASPLFHVNGSHVGLFGSICRGEKLVMMYKWDAGRALKLIEDEKVQAIVGVPTNTYDLVNHPDFKKYDTSSMDTFQNARASTGYGLTETNAVSVVMPAELFPARPTSCGLPAVNVNVCILDENNHKLPPGGVGEICFRGATIMKEYWRKPDKTSEVFHIDEHGQLWFRSGDIGALDEQNFVYILDRAKDIIIRGGENISCAEVEQAIFEHPTVAEVAAIGLPHENLGETVAVAVVFKTGSSAPDAEELREHAASLLPRHMVPSDVFVWKEALPRGATGKIQKRDIREEITKHYVPFEAEFAVAVFVGSYLAIWAAVFSSLAGDWSFLDGFYFCMVTLTTVGYGDLTPCESPLCRLLGITFIWTNVLVVSAVLGIVGARVEREVTRVGRPSVSRRIAGYFASAAESRLKRQLKPYGKPTRAAISLLVLLLFALTGGLIFKDAGGEHWSINEAIYFATVTMTTVGYGDIAPVTTGEQKVLAILFVWLSITLLAVLFGFISAEAEQLEQLIDYPQAKRKRHGGRAVLLLSGLHLLCAASFAVVESWSFVDSLYFTSVTLTTVGYGDLAPKTKMGRMMTSALVLTGVPTTVALVQALSGSIAGQTRRFVTVPGQFPAVSVPCRRALSRIGTSPGPAGGTPKASAS